MKIDIETASQHVLDLLKEGPASSEQLTDYCKKQGIEPKDDRAFGAVYLSLHKKGLIYKTGHCLRRKGHGTTGGNIWAACTENY